MQLPDPLNVIVIKPQPLTLDGFGPFGDVITARGEPLSINCGATQRFHNLANLDPGRNGKLIVSIFRSRPAMMPFTIKVMENHPLGSQAFVPLQGRPYIAVVAPPGPLDPHKIQAFYADRHQGVNFRPGVWHHYNLALKEESDFLVIDRDGPGINLQEAAVRCPVMLIADDIRQI